MKRLIEIKLSNCRVVSRFSRTSICDCLIPNAQASAASAIPPGPAPIMIRSYIAYTPAGIHDFQFSAPHGVNAVFVNRSYMVPESI